MYDNLWRTRLPLPLLLSFFFALFMTILAYASTTKTPASNSLFPQLMLYRLALVLENRVLDILSLIQHIYDYGLYYLKTAFLAVVGHFAGLLIVLAQRRAVAFISRHRVRLDKAQYLEIFSGSCLALGPWLLWALHPKLRRILWMYYYFYCRDGYTPSIEDIRRRIVMASPTFSWETISIVTGPLVIYSSWACLRTVYLALLHLPSTIWAIVRSFRPGGLPIFVAIVSLWTWIATVIFRFLADISFTSSELKPLGRGIRRWFHDLEDLASSSPEAREQLAQFRRFYKERHNNWRIMQKKEFHELVRLLWESMWVRAHWSQKVLIAAPVIIIYSYFYIMPVVRNVIPRVQYWRWRRRRRSAQRSVKLNHHDRGSNSRDTSGVSGAAMKTVGDARLFFATSKTSYLKILKGWSSRLMLRAVLGSFGFVRLPTAECQVTYTRS
ncbi:hypothetical protein FB45DRAFT_1096979 [Roridomyces roridus]|uniref:Uncharacterized protein n=1 Tax=Roridomyces roridus TaxID=1738132 RepID=A0AAD7BE15_9AGAR|nr:hypothetical protein FB45DRAFT_1096979 [Roridomyces roridus]